ncbi:Cna protein B-type domain protein [Bifidobacterium saguini DSM 23967]|uniref:Cna protein B-type domain protein n=1 Tax=Bifidobacterium saguini DSM 23967 TaxID=1437607 RepID=A0A087D6V3_9BIFI|nr:SpaA isopeptide-forming pilin-related protein [Bifidobacterium saguini]KFI91253.1 Cna protein B-type domain protein [Bifidobacterium saguini DSM 23967]
MPIGTKRLMATACMAAMMLTGIGVVSGSAYAASETITLQGADGASLAGHTFNVYQIGSYTGVELDGSTISGLGVTGSDASNAWAADAIRIANAYTTDTSDDIRDVAGYDSAGDIAAIRMDETSQLSNIQAALNASGKKPSPITGGADLTGNDATLEVTVPEAGLYYVTDSAGMPLIVGTKAGAGEHMKDQADRALGVAVIKSKSVDTDKKVVLERDGKQVVRQGDTADPASATLGDTVTHTIDTTVPTTAVKFKLTDTPSGETYVKGSLKVVLAKDSTDVTKSVTLYDGSTQNNATILPGDNTMLQADGTAADPDITVPAGGWAMDLTPLIASNGGAKITVSYQSVISGNADGKPAENTVVSHGVFQDGNQYTIVDSDDKVDVESYGFTLAKTDAESTVNIPPQAANATDTANYLNGAGFQIQDGDGDWLTRDKTTGAWSKAKDQQTATTFVTGDTNMDGTVDSTDDAAGKGLIEFTGLGAGTYTVTETKAPKGYASWAMPSLTVTIDDAGTITYQGKDQPGLTSTVSNDEVQVKNIANLTQLPQTGGALAAMFWIVVSAPVWGAGLTLTVKALKDRRDLAAAGGIRA